MCRRMHDRRNSRMARSAPSSRLLAAIAAVFMPGARNGRPQARQIAVAIPSPSEPARDDRVPADSRRPINEASLLPESNDEDVVMIANGPGGRGEVAEHRHLTCQAHVGRGKPSLIKSIVCGRPETSIGDIARQTGFGPRSIRKWLKVSTPPERRAAAAKPCSPNYFLDYLSRRWAEVRSRPKSPLRDQAPRL